jgi:hypothetical protein
MSTALMTATALHDLRLKLHEPNVAEGRTIEETVGRAFGVGQLW